MPRTAAARLEIRPLRSADRALIAAAFARLSPASRHQRFHGAKPALSAADLDALTRVDYISRDAIVAVDRKTGRLVGVARYVVDPSNRSEAELALVVADEWQGRGLGLRLSRTILCRAGGTGIGRLTAAVLHDNVRTLALLRKLGFQARSSQAGVIE